MLPKASTRPVRIIPCPQRALGPADLRCIARSHARLSTVSDLRILNLCCFQARGARGAGLATRSGTVRACAWRSRRSSKSPTSSSTAYAASCPASSSAVPLSADDLMLCRHARAFKALCTTRTSMACKRSGVHASSASPLHVGCVVPDACPRPRRGSPAGSESARQQTNASASVCSLSRR